MLKAIFGVLLAAMLFAMGFVVGSSPHPVDSTENQGAAKTSQKADYYDPYRALRDWFTKDAAGFFTFWLFVIGGSQIALFYVQLRLIRESLAPAQTAAKAAQAAAEYIPVVEGAHVYVLMKGEDLFSDLLKSIGAGHVGSPDYSIMMDLVLKNFGKTPAFIEGFTAHIFYVSGTSRISGFEARFQPNTLVGAGEESIPRLTVSAPHLSQSDAEMIWRAAAALILQGTLIYRDIWGNEWMVRFDGRFENETSSFRLDNYPRQKNTQSSAALSEPFRE